MTTIGVAVAVPDPWGARLQEYRSSLGDSSAAGIPTHVTLLSPIDVETALLPGITDHLAEVAGSTAAFEILLRGTGTFRPVSPVVFINVVQGISGFEQLAAAVRRGPLAIEASYPYHPHVTVAHDLADPLLERAFAELADFECEFVVDRFALYVHRQGVGWEPANEFGLSPGAR